ncbi:MAG: hypothetical protein H6734_22965 [Alphaproteobacteria bacterium]|nr:hypothetical protein [Alphaproteobacteria bacterium]
MRLRELLCLCRADLFEHLTPPVEGLQLVLECLALADGGVEGGEVLHAIAEPIDVDVLCHQSTRLPCLQFGDPGLLFSELVPGGGQLRLGTQEQGLELLRTLLEHGQPTGSESGDVRLELLEAIVSPPVRFLELGDLLLEAVRDDRPRRRLRSPFHHGRQPRLGDPLVQSRGQGAGVPNLPADILEEGPEVIHSHAMVGPHGVERALNALVQQVEQGVLFRSHIRPDVLAQFFHLPRRSRAGNARQALLGKLRAQGIDACAEVFDVAGGCWGGLLLG